MYEWVFSERLKLSFFTAGCWYIRRGTTQTGKRLSVFGWEYTA